MSTSRLVLIGTVFAAIATQPRTAAAHPAISDFVCLSSGQDWSLPALMPNVMRELQAAAPQPIHSRSETGLHLGFSPGNHFHFDFEVGVYNMKYS